MLRRVLPTRARAGADRLGVQRRPGGRASPRPRTPSRRPRPRPRPPRPSGSASSRGGGRRRPSSSGRPGWWARMSLPDLAGQVIVAEWSGTAAPVRDGPPAAPRRGDRVLRQRRVDRSDPVRQRDPGARRTTPVAAVPVRRPGGRHRRAGQGRRHPLPDLHVRRCGGGPAGDRRRPTAPAPPSCAGSASTWSSRRTPTSPSGPGDPTIGSRSAGSDAAVVGEHVAAAVDGIEQAAVVPVLKHFPGHGSVPQDSHLTLPVQTRTRKQLAAVDLAPFAAAVEAGRPRRDGGPHRREVDRPAGALLDVAGGGHRGAARAARLRGARGHRLAVDGGRRSGSTTPRARPSQGLRAGNDVLLMPPSPAAAARAGIVRAVRERPAAAPPARAGGGPDDRAAPALRGHARPAAAAARRAPAGPPPGP